MSVDRRLVNLGIFLLILGAIPLAVSQGWIARETISRAWELWPLILIGIGIGLILRRTPFHFAGGLLVAATVGTMSGALLAGALSLGALGCGNAAAATDPSILDEHGTFAGGTSSVVLRATCASLSVGPASGAGWGVTVTGTAGARPTLEQAANRLEVRSPDGPVVVPFADGRRSRWNVTLGSDAAYTLVDVNLNAGEANIDLAGLRVETLTAQGNGVGNSRLLLHDATVGHLDVQINAGDLKIGLPAGAGLVGRIQANAASVALCADPGTGLRLRNTSVVSGDNFAAAGLVRAGSTWESPGVGSAAHIIDLALDGAANSFTLNPSEGCR
jgi:hypothetical protein